MDIAGDTDGRVTMVVILKSGSDEESLRRLFRTLTS